MSFLSKMRPPLHYLQYWKLEDKSKSLADLARSVLLHYIQSWGQENKERLETLAVAANAIGFEVCVVLNNGEYCFKYKDENFEQMRDEIRNIHRGNFESEVVQIASILERYKIIRKKWWQFWKNSKTSNP